MQQNQQRVAVQAKAAAEHNQTYYGISQAALLLDAKRGGLPSQGNAASSQARLVYFSFVSADHDLPAAFLKPGNQSRMFFEISSSNDQPHGIHLLSKKWGDSPP